jgi:predicted ABC-type sugar transport system permease subunit
MRIAIRLAITAAAAAALRTTIEGTRVDVTLRHALAAARRRAIRVELNVALVDVATAADLGLTGQLEIERLAATGAATGGLQLTFGFRLDVNVATRAQLSSALWRKGDGPKNRR